MATERNGAPQSSLLAPPEAARRLGITERTLGDWRRRGTGPAWVRLGTRTVRYPEARLDAWLTDRMSAADQRGRA